MGLPCDIILNRPGRAVRVNLALVVDCLSLRLPFFMERLMVDHIMEKPRRILTTRNSTWRSATSLPASRPRNSAMPACRGARRSGPGLHKLLGPSFPGTGYFRATSGAGNEDTMLQDIERPSPNLTGLGRQSNFQLIGVAFATQVIGSIALSLRVRACLKRTCSSGFIKP
jgi:hypothetical protein